MFQTRSRAGFLVVVLSLLLCEIATATHAAAAGSPVSDDPLPTASTPPVTNAVPAVSAERDLLPKEIRPGLFQLGDVRIDKSLRTITFPARLNLSEGPMEYFLVTTWGKAHESVLQTKTEPYRIHLAMLLLNGAGSRFDPRWPPAPKALREGPPPSSSGFISHPSKSRLPGDDVRIEIRWTVNGRETRRRAEEMVVNEQTRSAPLRGDWVYTGSRVWGGVFLAEREGSLISLITDPEALVNNEAPGHDNDTIWTANTNNLPPTNTVVQVVIKLGKNPVR